MRALLVASFSCVAACSLITPLDDLGSTGGSDATGDNVTQQDAPINDAVIDVPLAQCADAGYTVCGSACVDLKSDAQNVQ